MQGKTKLGLVVVTLLVGGVALYAAPWGRGGDKQEGRGGDRGGRDFGGRAPMCKMMEGDKLKEMGATDEQIQALKDARLDQTKQEIKLRADVETAEVQFHSLMESATPDKDGIMKAVDTLNAARGEAFKAHITSALKMKEILGKDLCAKMQEARKARWGEEGKEGKGMGEKREGRSWGGEKGKEGKGMGEKGEGHSWGGKHQGQDQDKGEGENPAEKSGPEEQ